MVGESWLRRMVLILRNVDLLNLQRYLCGYVLSTDANKSFAFLFLGQHLMGFSICTWFAAVELPEQWQAFPFCVSILAVGLQLLDIANVALHAKQMKIVRSAAQMKVQMLFWKLMVYSAVEQVQSVLAHLPTSGSAESQHTYTHPILASGFGANPCFVSFPLVHFCIYDFDSQLGWTVHYLKCVH